MHSQEVFQIKSRRFHIDGLDVVTGLVGGGGGGIG